MNLGLLAAARGRWQEAGKLQQSALAEAEKEQMPEETAVSRRNLAELALMQGDIADAVAQADKAIELFHQREDQRGEADTRLLRVQALLAAGADTDAQHELKLLETGGTDASLEQRAGVEIVRAELALHANQTRNASALLDRAQPLAEASGVRELQLQVALLRARIEPRADTGLDASTASLGNAELRLQWLVLAMQRALAARDSAAALRAYREAISLMRGSDVLDAAQIHSLGASAQRLAGDAPAAADADVAAATAKARFRARLPAQLRDIAPSASAAAPTAAKDQTTP
ncbi:MAG: hypothetical protein WDW36_002485 [Sanguina aurantia]